jgi:hypothetical protein
MPRKRLADVWVLIAAVALIAVLSVLRASQSGAPSVPSTYDTGPHGYAAIYALLQREKIRVAQFEAPLTALPARGTLVVAGFAPLQQLDGWVRRGGTLVALGPEPWLPPKHVRALRKSERVIAYRRGKGTVVYAPSTQMFENAKLLIGGNAAFAYRLFSALPGRVGFDERIYGHAADRTFWQVLPAPMHAAIYIACIALLLAAIGANLPFAPPYAAQETAQRGSGEYIESLAQMLERGNAGREIVSRLCGETIALVHSRAAGDAHARELLAQARSLQALPHLGREQVLAAGTLFARARKDYA